MSNEEPVVLMNLICKNDLYPRFKLVSLLLIVLFSSAASAKATDQLPSGTYVYLGRQPGLSQPHLLVVTDNGQLHWQSSGEAVSSSESVPISSTGIPNVIGNGPIQWQTNTAPDLSQAANNVPFTPVKAAEPLAMQGQAAPVTKAPSLNWDSYCYPIIKWKAKPLGSTPGGLVQLSTTYEKSSNRLIGGKVKWKMTLYKAPLPMYLHSKAVRLLDANGFELVSQRIRAFNPVSGTDFVEGFGETMVPEEVYMRAKDYSAE